MQKIIIYFIADTLSVNCILSSTPQVSIVILVSSMRLLKNCCANLKETVRFASRFRHCQLPRLTCFDYLAFFI